MFTSSSSPLRRFQNGHTKIPPINLHASQKGIDEVAFCMSITSDDMALDLELRKWYSSGFASTIFDNVVQEYHHRICFNSRTRRHKRASVRRPRGLLWGLLGT